MRVIPVLLLLYGLSGYLLVRGWYPCVGWLQGGLFGWFWPVFVGFVGLAMVAFSGRFSRRDPILFSWMVFGFAGCLLLAPLIAARVQQGSLDDAADALVAEFHDKQIREFRVRQAAERERLLEELKNRPRDRFSQYDGRVSATDLAAVRDLDERLLSDLQSRADHYKSVLDGNPVLGPTAWQSFQSREQLDAEIEAHRRIYEATRAFTTYVEGFEESYLTAIDDLALKPPADRIAVAEMERILQSWRADHSLDLRRLDVEVLSAALGALNILEDQWGQWNWNPREDTLSFDNPRAEEAYMRSMARFVRAMKAVEQLRDQETDKKEGS